MELVKRGHRLIADDAVELRRVSDRTISGTAPENIRHFIELRGVGIINVARVFGSGAEKMSEKSGSCGWSWSRWDKTRITAAQALRQIRRILWASNCPAR